MDMTNTEEFNIIFDKYQSALMSVGKLIENAAPELKSSLNNIVTLTQDSINWPTITHLLSSIFKLESDFESSYDQNIGKLISNKKINIDKSIENTENLSQICKEINKNLGKARVICLTIYNKSHQSICDEYLDQTEKTLDFLIQKEQKAKMITELISPKKEIKDPKQLEELRNALLDKFNAEELTAEELKRQMDRLSGTVKVFRTITSFTEI